MSKVNLVSAVWREGKYYIAQCLNIDVSSFGKTRAAALANLREALELYLEDGSDVRIAEIKDPDLQYHEFLYAPQ